MLLLMLLLALSSTNSRRRTFSAHYISEYINMRGKKSALENSVSKPEKSKYWSVWCWGKRRRDFFLRSIGIRSRWLCGGCMRHSKVCVELKEDSTLMHMFKSTAVLLLAWVHICTHRACWDHEKWYACEISTCVPPLSLTIHHKPSNSKSHFRRNQVKPGFATILVRFYEMKQHASTVLSMVCKVKKSFLLWSTAVDKRPQIFFFLRAVNFCE